MNEGLTLREVAGVLQLAVGPVVLISGVGLLILSLTNRFGRIVDRTRALVREMADGPELPSGRAQVRILMRRARLIRRAVVLSVACVLGAALLVLTLFAEAFFGWNAVLPLVALFGTSLGLLAAALVAFLQEVQLSLHALEIEVDESLGAEGG